MSQSRPFESRTAWRIFWACTAALTLIRLVLAAVELPPFVSTINAVIFIAVPFLALFAAANGEPKVKQAWLLLGAGVLAHVALGLTSRFLGGVGWLAVVADALAQAGLLTWCTGLGALVGYVIKDKNLIIPVAIFLVGFDCWLVFNPASLTSKVLKVQPQIFQSVAMQVPDVQADDPEDVDENQPRTSVLVYVGPADLIFGMTFFFVLFRFNLRAKKTALWMTPVLIGYLLLVLIARMPLPALVPIGLTVLLVNRRQFELNKEEKQAVWGVTVLAAGLAGYGIYRAITYVPPEPPTEPSIEQAAPALPESEETPARAS
jgi:hypothetical protein